MLHTYYMKNPFGIKERKCALSDHSFIYELTRTTIFPYVSAYLNPSKQVFNESFRKNRKTIKILLKGKRRIGFYGIRKDKNVLTVNKLFLSKTYQNIGIGTFLMNYFESSDIQKIRLEVWDNNPAVKFYEKLGYKIKARKGHKYVMEKSHR